MKRRILHINKVSKSPNFNKLVDRIKESNNILEISRVLSYANISFVVNYGNRLMSLLIMENKDSYTEQSLRYCKVDELEVNMDSVDSMYLLTQKTFENLDNELIKLHKIYKEMIRLKDTFKSGRPRRDDYVHGILPEEARAVLPMGVTTHFIVTMTADKLIDLYQTIKDNRYIFNEFKKQLDVIIGPILSEKLNVLISANIIKPEISDILMDNTESYPTVLEGFSKDRVAMGARISANKDFDIDKEYEEAKDDALISRILGYNHTSISEHQLVSFKGKLSMLSFQQLVRHRFFKLYREDFVNKNSRLIGYDEPILPNNVADFKYDGVTVKTILRSYINFFNYSVVDCRYLEKETQLLQNYMLICYPIRFVATTNMSSFDHTCKKRLCNNAQTEIKDLFIEGYNIFKDDRHFIPFESQYLPDCCVKGCKEGKLTCGIKFNK